MTATLASQSRIATGSIQENPLELKIQVAQIGQNHDKQFVWFEDRRRSTVDIKTENRVIYGWRRVAGREGVY